METRKKVKESKAKQLVMLLGIIALLLFLVWFFFLRSTYGDIWAETTVPYDPQCETGCESVDNLPKGGAHGSAPMKIMINPNVDDPTAQWGDCLESVFSCVGETSTPFDPMDKKAAAFRLCVKGSTCPPVCIEKFTKAASKSDEAVQLAFDDIFLKNDGWCVPREGQ